jgi:hypothetical protein
MYFDDRKQYTKSTYVANKQFDQLITHNMNNNIQLDDELFSKPVLIKSRKNEYDIQLNNKHKYQKKTREIRYQRFMMDLSEMDDVPNITVNTKVECIAKSSKKHPTPQYFKWCSCHIYKSDRKVLNGETCYRTCESHPRNV